MRNKASRESYCVALNVTADHAEDTDTERHLLDKGHVAKLIKTRRATAMIDASQIKEQMEVKGSDGKHLGTVDGVDGQRVKLAAGGGLHYIDIAIVESIKGGAVCLNKTAGKMMQSWH